MDHEKYFKYNSGIYVKFSEYAVDVNFQISDSIMQVPCILILILFLMKILFLLTV